MSSLLVGRSRSSLAVRAAAAIGNATEPAAAFPQTLPPTGSERKCGERREGRSPPSGVTDAPTLRAAGAVCIRGDLQSRAAFPQIEMRG